LQQGPAVYRQNPFVHVERVHHNCLPAVGQIAVEAVEAASSCINVQYLSVLTW
jgi:hypothetical protein